MSATGVAAVRLLIQDATGVIDRLDEADWERASACSGWRVQDVITHMAAFFHLLSDPGAAPAGETQAERINDAAVRERAGWSPERVRAYYAEQSAAGLAVLESFEDPALASVAAPLAELGTYRLSELANAMAFDHLVHLSVDLLAPFGPLDQPPVPVDDARLRPALDWMLAGLPQMCGAALHPALERPLGVALHGTAARSFVLRRDPDRPGEVRLDEDAAPPADVVASSTEDFLRWATTRTPWRSVVTVTGDAAHAAAVLDAIDFI